MQPNIFQKLLVLLPLAYPPQQTNDADDDGAAVTHWNYEQLGADWEGTCASGIRQSPIRLSRDSSLILPLPRIYFGNYGVKLKGPLTVRNNGHAVDMRVPTTRNGQKPFIMGGILKGQYVAEGVHFHWGSPNSHGAEHVINKKRYDVEMHIVHRNVNYRNVEEAINYPDGLAVLAVMFKVVKSTENVFPGLRKIFTELPKIIEYGSDADLAGTFSLSQLLGDLNTRDFYTYKGSLTTPGCAEAVTFTVFAQPLPLPVSQLPKLWQLKDSDGNLLQNNYRETQPRNNRPVFYRTSKDLSNYFIG